MKTFDTWAEFTNRPITRQPGISCEECIFRSDWEKEPSGKDVFAKCELLYPGMTFNRREYSLPQYGCFITPLDGCDLGRKK